MFKKYLLGASTVMVIAGCAQILPPPENARYLQFRSPMNDAPVLQIAFNTGQQCGYALTGMKNSNPTDRDMQFFSCGIVSASNSMRANGVVVNRRDNFEFNIEATTLELCLDTAAAMIEKGANALQITKSCRYK